MSAMLSKPLQCADLFCGGGGFTSGLMAVARELGYEVDLLAVNHWTVAIETHSLNHPGVRHLCQSIDTINPREVIPSGKLDVLLASPECTHFSTARGGKPMSDQKRATPWCILKWLEQLDVSNVIIENVPEFQTWGPLNAQNRPIPSKKGLYFRNFLRNLRTLGYRVDFKVLNAADYGAATTRRRLFILARKGRRRIAWPEPTHYPPLKLNADQGLLYADERKPWRAAREIIDWNIEGASIYGRKKPLALNTLARIEAGLRRFCGLPFIVPQFSENEPRSVDAPLGTITTTSRGVGLAEPFLVVLRNHGDAQSLDEPAPTLCANGGHLGLAQPFILPRQGYFHQEGQNVPRSLDQPLNTIVGAGAGHLVDPFLVAVNHGPEERDHSLDSPLPTLTGKGTQALVEPFLIGQQSCAAPRSVDEPTPTIAAAGAIALAEPCLVNMKGKSDASSIDAPAPTITAHAQHLGVVEPYIVDFMGAGEDAECRCRSTNEPLPSCGCSRRNGLAEPYLVPRYGERDGQQPRTHSLEEPIPTVVGTVQHALAEPFLVRYHGTDQGAHSVDDPLPTVTTRDRYALVHPELVRNGEVDGEIVGWLDIRFRMLKPHELAAAMSFPPGYQFAGNQEQIVRQIGNAVDVRMAKALVGAVIGGAK